MTQVRVMLECGHTQRVGSPQKLKRSCHQCNGPTRAVTHVKVGDGWQPIEAYRAERVDAHEARNAAWLRPHLSPDGCFVQHNPMTGEWKWWCLHCHGRKHRAWSSTGLKDAGAIQEAWSRHIESEPHLAEVRTKSLIDSIVDNIGR
jgi:hypothetical protein